ncbi:MAG: UDP-N-acetylmuramate dehydrogenase [Candidatus Cloacimonetes bacterium]|nr:UDP-N-acetylmuramate dehydrogenase [Candidatus Cloacimonadota bacterium]
MKERLKQAFPYLAERGALRFDEVLAPYSSFKIGGAADAFLMPPTIMDLAQVLSFALGNGIPYFILGKGSNLLISDQGIRALVINMSEMNKITRDENFVSTFSGVSLRRVAEFAQKEGLAGLEFAHGIPGSVGGAVFMNAGAYGGEIKDVLYCSKYLIPEVAALQGNYPVKHLKAAEHEFGYRSSSIQRKGYILTSSVFRLQEADPEEIKARMQELDIQRKDKQPMELSSAGSVFKRPPGHFAGKLIEDCCLKGYRVGDAAVSDKHCGFIVNLGKATAQDVMQVIRHVQNTVFERYSIKLELEIRLIGEM